MYWKVFKKISLHPPIRIDHIHAQKGDKKFQLKMVPAELKEKIQLQPRNRFIYTSLTDMHKHQIEVILILLKNE